MLFTNKGEDRQQRCGQPEHHQQNADHDLTSNRFMERILPSACMDTDQVENALDRNDTRNCRIDNDVHKQLCPLSQF